MKTALLSPLIASVIFLAVFFFIVPWLIFVLAVLGIAVFASVFFGRGRINITTVRITNTPHGNFIQTVKMASPTVEHQTCEDAEIIPKLDQRPSESKEVKMFITETCPHCIKAFSLMEEICREHPEYKTVKIEKIDETKETEYAAKFDYCYVPTFYVDGVKVHEGSPTKEAIEKVYAEAVI